MQIRPCPNPQISFMHHTSTASNSFVRSALQFAVTVLGLSSLALYEPSPFPCCASCASRAFMTRVVVHALDDQNMTVVQSYPLMLSQYVTIKTNTLPVLCNAHSATKIWAMNTGHLHDFAWYRLLGGYNNARNLTLQVGWSYGVIPNFLYQGRVQPTPGYATSRSSTSK